MLKLPWLAPVGLGKHPLPLRKLSVWPWSYTIRIWYYWANPIAPEAAELLHRCSTSLRRSPL